MNDAIMFDDKKFSDLLRDIYINNKKKETQINGLIEHLKDLVNNINDASILVPLIKEYLEVSVKNDEHLVKLASIVQRLIMSSDRDKEDGVLSDAERKQLLSEAQELIDHSK